VKQQRYGFLPEVMFTFMGNIKVGLSKACGLFETFVGHARKASLNREAGGKKELQEYARNREE